MKGTKTTYTADGYITKKYLHRAVTLDELQQNVKGYIETVPDFDTFDGKKAVAFCNEEGKVNGLQINAAATALWKEQVKAKGYDLADALCGDVVILTGDAEFMEAI